MQIFLTKNIVIHLNANANELKISIDSLEKDIYQYNSFSENFYKRTGIYNFQTNYTNKSKIPNIDDYNNILNDFDKPSKMQIISSMQNNTKIKLII